MQPCPTAGIGRGELIELFPQSLEAPPQGAITSSTEAVTIAPIEDLVGGRVTLDTRQLDKQPDWSYGGSDSGATPAARLGNTPVHVDGPSRPRPWPEWEPSESTERPLELIDDAHDAIEALIDRAMVDGADDLDDRLDDVVVAVRTHVDVTRRVLFPMARRVGDDDGERLADAAQAQERTLLRLVREIDRSDARSDLQDIGVAMHDHAAIGDELLALLRAELDATERSSLADGLAAAQTTSTVSRLHRGASKMPTPLLSTAPRPQAVDGDDTDQGAPAGDETDQGAAAGHDTHQGAVAGPAPEPSPRDQNDPAAAVGPGSGHAPPVEDTEPAATARPVRPGGQAPGVSGRAMLGRMLVGVDDSPGAAGALGWAVRLAGLLDAEVVMANVFEPGQAEVSPDEYHQLVKTAEEHLVEEWSASLQETNVDHRFVQLVGPPDALLAATEAEGAGLLVVGPRGAGRHAGLHLGSLAHHLAHYTRRPLAIVPLAGAASGVEHIVVGVDGSAGSAAAVSWCADVAAAAGAEVTAVCAFDPRPRWGSGGDPSDWRATAETAINDAWTAPLRAAGVVVRTRIIHDRHPRVALESAATDEGAGLFVVGTRGLSEVGGLRLGRLPMQLVHHSQLPVVLVPPAERG